MPNPKIPQIIHEEMRIQNRSYQVSKGHLRSQKVPTILIAQKKFKCNILYLPDFSTRFDIKHLEIQKLYKICIFFIH